MRLFSTGPAFNRFTFWIYDSKLRSLQFLISGYISFAELYLDRNILEFSLELKNLSCFWSEWCIDIILLTVRSITLRWFYLLDVILSKRKIWYKLYLSFRIGNGLFYQSTFTNWCISLSTDDFFSCIESEHRALKPCSILRIFLNDMDFNLLTFIKDVITGIDDRCILINIWKVSIYRCTIKDITIKSWCLNKIILTKRQIIYTCHTFIIGCKCCYKCILLIINSI